MGRLAQKARRGWWKRDSSARPGDGCKRRDARLPRGRRLTVAIPLDIVGELHRQRSNLRVRDTAKSRILDRPTAPPEQAIQIRRKSERNMQPGRGLVCARRGRASSCSSAHGWCGR